MATNGDVISLLELYSYNFDFVAKRFIEKFGEDLGSEKSLSRKIERVYKRRPKKPRDSPDFVNWSNKYFQESQNNPNDKENVPSGKSAHHLEKSLCDSKDSRTKRRKIQPLIDYISQFAEEEGILFNDVVDLLNAEVKSNKKTKVSISIPVEEATPFFFNGGFSSRSWTELRLFLVKFNVDLPTRNVIDLEKKSLLPKIISQEIKSSVTYPDLIHDTVSSLVKIADAISIIEPNDSLYLEAKTGIDGSGCHRARHQLVDLDKSADENPHLNPNAYKNFLLCCVCPLSFTLVKPGKSEKVILWKNPAPNSINFTRPLCLIRTTETRDVIQQEFDSLFKSIMHQSEQTISLANLQIPINIKNTVSMIDGKMVSILQGDSGAQCHYCCSTREEINDILCIMKGFEITKSFQSCTDSWNAVKSGNIDWKDPKRAGQCHQPLVEVNLFSILHWKLRSFDFALSLLYRLCAGVTVWGTSDKSQLPLVNKAKEHVQEHMRSKTGMLIDVPTAGGGNTNSGPMAERFFSPGNRDVVTELIQDDSDKENYKQFLCSTNCMISVCLSTRPKLVNTEKLRQLGIDIMSHIRSKWPWVPINPSLHQMCAHSWQLFMMTYPEPIAIYSEQSQEHWNKHLSRFKSGTGARARQHSVKTNINDVFARMLHLSNPLVASKKRSITCGKCGELGHGAKSQIHHGDDNLNINEEDSLFHLYEE